MQQNQEHHFTIYDFLKYLLRYNLNNSRSVLERKEDGNTAKKMKFSITDFFSKCDQICSFPKLLRLQFSKKNITNNSPNQISPEKTSGPINKEYQTYLAENLPLLNINDKHDSEKRHNHLLYHHKQILGWCPAGTLLPHGEKVPLQPWLAILLMMLS